MATDVFTSSLTLREIQPVANSMSPTSPLPFLIMQLRPEDVTADNEFEAIKFYAGLADRDVVRLRVEQSGLANIELSRFAGIIVGGSPFDVSTPGAEKTAIQLQIEAGFDSLFRDIIAHDFPFMGCCSGNGLLGSFCGASISGKYAEPVSGVDISLTDEGKQDPLLAGLPDSFRVLLGHKEAFCPAFAFFSRFSCLSLATFSALIFSSSTFRGSGLGVFPFRACFSSLCFARLSCLAFFSSIRPDFFS